MSAALEFDPYSPERLADRARIQDIMLRWCRAVDRLDLAVMPELFHEDMQDNHGSYRGDRAGMIRWIGERHQSITFSMHLVSNILIEFSNPDLALVETTILSAQRYAPEARESLAQSSGGKLGEPGMATDVTGSARYVDRFERRDGKWKIARRTVVFGWKRMEPVPADGPAPLPAWEIQRRDGSDFIFRERAALGIG